MRADSRSDHPDEQLLRGAACGTLDGAVRAELDRHAATCPICAAELEARGIFRVSLARDAADDDRDRAAVERATARLGAGQASGPIAPRTEEEALDQIAVERAMSYLGAQKRSRSGVRRFIRPATGFAALGAAAAAAISFAVFRKAETTPTVAATTIAAPSTRTLALADGSEIAPEDGTTPIQITEDSPLRTTVRLSAGAARFRVRHDVRRLFRVEAGPIQVEDLGTVFRVAHEPAGRVRVTVSEGRVAVVEAASRLRVELGAGEDRVFSASPETRDIVEQTFEGGTTALLPVKGASRGPSRAQDGDDPAGLLAAADVARRSRSPREAVARLRRLLDRYPRDPRAPSAAFTLGWVLLTDLNRPREAAVAFAEAERIAPRGALAEDAAARVAEAWQKAGEPRRAAAAARHYAQLYPTGRYIALMRGLIGGH